MSHPLVLTPEPCFSFPLVSTVSFVCAGRGVRAGGAGRDPRSTADAQGRPARVSLSPKEFSDVCEVVLVLLAFVAQCSRWMDGWADVIQHLLGRAVFAGGDSVTGLGEQGGVRVTLVTHSCCGAPAASHPSWWDPLGLSPERGAGDVAVADVPSSVQELGGQLCRVSPSHRDSLPWALSVSLHLHHWSPCAQTLLQPPVPQRVPAAAGTGTGGHGGSHTGQRQLPSGSSAPPLPGRRSRERPPAAD